MLSFEGIYLVVDPGEGFVFQRAGLGVASKAHFFVQFQAFLRCCRRQSWICIQDSRLGAASKARCWCLAWKSWKGTSLNLARESTRRAIVCALVSLSYLPLPIIPSPTEGEEKPGGFFHPFEGGGRMVIGRALKDLPSCLGCSLS